MSYPTGLNLNTSLQPIDYTFNLLPSPSDYFSLSHPSRSFPILESPPSPPFDYTSSSDRSDQSSGAPSPDTSYVGTPNGSPIIMPMNLIPAPQGDYSTGQQLHQQEQMYHQQQHQQNQHNFQLKEAAAVYDFNSLSSFQSLPAAVAPAPVHFAQQLQLQSQIPQYQQVVQQHQQIQQQLLPPLPLPVYSYAPAPSFETPQGTYYFVPNTAVGVIPVNQWGAGMMQDEDRKPIISKKMAVGVKVPRKTAPRKNAGKGQAKRFVCPQPDCGRGFARNFNMQSHLKSHLGIRDFSCPHCPKKFSRRHDRARHCAAVHDAQVDDDFDRLQRGYSASSYPEHEHENEEEDEEADFEVEG